MKQTFILTEADVKLLNTMESNYTSVFQYPNATEINQNMMKDVWYVLAEKHGFIAETLEQHPDGEPKILAEPIISPQNTTNEKDPTP